MNGRYDLHELLRQYAAEKLIEAGEAETAAQRHLDYFLKFAEQVEAHNFGREQIAWYDQAELEFDNLRAALTHSVETESGLRLVTALGWFFSERGHWIEGLTSLKQALGANPDAPTSLRSKAFQLAAMFPSKLADRPQARAMCEQALALARPANDRWNIAWALSHMAIYGCDDAPESVALLKESIVLFRELDDRMGLCHTLIRRTFWPEIGEGYSYIRTLAQEALRHGNEVDDTIIAGWGNFVLGNMSLLDHHLTQARRHFERSKTLWRKAQFVSQHHALQLLAVTEHMAGKPERARMICREFLLLPGQYPVNRNFLNPVIGVVLALIAGRHRGLERAVTLLGASNIREWVQISVSWPGVSVLKDEVVTLLTHLGEATFAEAWAVGNTMTAQEAEAYALEDTVETVDTIAEEPSADQVLRETFTERELEILRLIADGLSNGKIADQLVLAKSTVKWYVHQFFGKLDATSRTQAVARARSIGLLS